MRVAITGITGRVGAAFAARLAENHHIIPLPRAICDLADPSSLKNALDSLDLKYPAVDKHQRAELAAAKKELLAEK